MQIMYSHHMTTTLTKWNALHIILAPGAWCHNGIKDPEVATFHQSKACWGWPTTIQMRVKTSLGCLQGESGASWEVIRELTQAFTPHVCVIKSSTRKHVPTTDTRVCLQWTVTVGVNKCGLPFTTLVNFLIHAGLLQLATTLVNHSIGWALLHKDPSGPAWCHDNNYHTTIKSPSRVDPRLCRIFTEYRQQFNHCEQFTAAAVTVT